MDNKKRLLDRFGAKSYIYWALLMTFMHVSAAITKIIIIRYTSLFLAIVCGIMCLLTYVHNLPCECIEEDNELVT